jgi:6-phosphogluconolactonase
VTDLGGDAVHQYSLDAHGKLTDITTLSFNPGEGPRHVDFNPQKKDILYVVCELSNDIVVFTRSGRAWQRKQTVTLIDAKYKGRKDPRFKQPASAAAIAVTQDASMLYATVRYIPESHDADIIVSMALQRDGLIDESHVRTFDTQTVGPRDIALSMDSEQRYLAAAFKESNLVRIYDRLKEFEVVCELEVEKPSCIHFQ